VGKFPQVQVFLSRLRVVLILCHLAINNHAPFAPFEKKLKVKEGSHYRFVEDEAKD
jgi:hypothetical protein